MTVSKSFPAPLRQLLDQYWAKGMSASYAFTEARKHGHSVTYHQVSVYYNSKTTTFNTAFMQVFK